MARIRYEDRRSSPEFTSLSMAAVSHGETNDCTVKAMAVTTGLTYAECHAALKAAGRINGRGASFQVQEKAYRSVGFRLVQANWKMMHEIIAQYPGAHKNLKSITTHHPVRFAKVWAEQPAMVLHTKGHVSAFKDGKLHDWAVGRALRVIDIRLVNKLPIDGQAVDWATGKAI